MSIKDIAKIAEVSVSTVSRSLQDSPLISQKTKDKITKIAKKHNFAINTRASNFRKQKSHTVAMLCNLNHSEKQETSDQFLFSLVNSISKNLVQHHYDLLLHTTLNITADLASSYVHKQKVDGLIIFGQGITQHKELCKLSKTNIPFVVWGGHVDDQYTTVGGKNFQGGYIATQHLLEQQKKRKLVFLGVAEHLEIDQRQQGFLQALKEANLKPAYKSIDKPAFCIDSGYIATQHLLDAQIDFDGLFCASDTIALGAIKCLLHNKIAIPKKVAVMGYDDISIAKDWSPTLTTIHQDTTIAGRLLVEKVLAKIEGNETHSTQIDVELIKRESA